MKIIHIIPTLGSGGAERLTVDLVNELSKKHDIYLVVLFGLDQALNTFFLSQVSPLVDVITFNKRRGPDFSIFWKLKNLIKRVKPDVINTHLSAVNYVLPFLGNPEISFIHTIHSEPRHEAKTKIEYWSRKLAYKKRLITPITISFDSQKSFQEYYNINNDILIFNGREQISVTPEIDSVRTVVNTIRKDKNTKVLISIGRFVPLKRQFLLASIINELVQEGENTGLILLGADDSVYATEVKNQIAELNCNQIITLGKVANVSDYLISVDAFCISSELEGMPMSYIEALSVGCIPISTPVGGLATLITKDIGFLAEDLSRSAIKESIRKYLNTPSSVLQQMKAAAYDQFEELFVITKTASQYITAYEKNRLLIIGKVPPPVGGITVHVDRLLYYLNEKEVKHKFVELRVKNAFRLLIALLQNKTFHLHTSNSKIKFALVIIGKLLGNRVIATLHTDIDRHVGLDGWFEKCVIKIADIPIVLNKNSYHKANKLNKSTILLSAFLPPYTLTRLSSLYQEQLRALKMKTKKTYCTNASKFGLDKNGQEIYGILKILSLFKNHPDYGLVISDSSGDYQRYFSQNNIKLSSNILVISEIHDFNAVINETDGMIRFTTVDGDAVSVKEALYHGKPVWASSVVSRPDGVVLIHDLADLENHIFNQTPPKVKPFLDESLVKLITIYKKQS